ncbi:hypothetical protein BSKO_10874 [Bryopsis sp. KO-2023]|nr:hypothetical protein BSKO_10874 [Bryopsis sp. KO-2023]
MGRQFLEYVGQETSSKFVCALCCTDVACCTALIWEGFMAAQQPAYLFRETVNVEPYAGCREELLSTGMYTLEDVQCRKCCTHLGWKYLRASRSEQKYKEGSTLLQQELLKRINCPTKVVSNRQQIQRRAPVSRIRTSDNS